MRIPAAAQPVLDRYRVLLEERAPGLVVGLYLHGSAALGSYVEEKSDLDFYAVLSRPADEWDVAALESIHRDLAREHPRPEMQGSYLQRGDFERSGEVPPYPAYSDGKLRLSTSLDVSPVDRWVLRRQGVTVFGPELEAQDLSVSWGEVAAYMVGNLQTYWASWLTTPWRLAYLLTDEGVEWAVLGICRLVYGLEEGAIVSKLGAGEYALTLLPPQWRPLVEEAIALRRGKGGRRRPRIERALEVRAFLSYVIDRYGDERG